MTQPTMLVGRTRELSELDRHLGEARAGSPVLALVEGPPGIGKSALVQRFTELLDDWQLRTSAGVPWEARRAWSTVEQLLQAPATGRDPVEVAHELLSLVDDPTVLVVDDAHWSDSESLQALSSAVRRAHGRQLLVLLVIVDPLPDTIPDSTRQVLDHHRAVSVHVGPLGPQDIAQLALTRIGVDLSPWTARRLFEHTHGTPRPVLQLLDEIPRDQWQHWQARFPAPQERAGAVRRTLDRCPAETRALVEAAAVLGPECTLTQAAALAGLADPTAALDAAHTAGVLRRREQRGTVTLVFPDPMTRAAVADDIGPARWRDLNARAAELVDDEGAALTHLVSATATADADLADRLDRYGRRRAAVGAWSDAAEALIVASGISPDRDQRAQRLIRGVDALTGAADLPQALTFVPAVETAPDGSMRDVVLGYLAIQRGRQDEAAQLLGRAWQLLPDPARDPDLGAMICQRMVLHSLARLDGAGLVEWADRASSLVAADTPAAVESAAIRGLGLAMTGHVDEARTSYAALPESVRLGAQGQRIRMAEGWLALALDEPERARAELESAEPTVFRGGSIRISLWAQAWLARTEFALGAWDDAVRTVDRAAAQLDTAGLDLLRPLVHWTGAQVHALRGDWTLAREHLRRGRAGATDYAVMVVPACLAAAQCAEVAADYDGVLRHLAPLTAHRRQALVEPGFWPWPDLYANALVMTGRVDEADEFLRPFEDLAGSRGHLSARARLGYVRGRIHGARGDIDAARETFEAALENLATLSLPYDRARVNFAYGQTLRRAGRRREADAVMRTARELYATLGATSYVQRCDRELKAGGLKASGDGTRRSHMDLAALTPQEKAVAALVAAGNTNKDVAGELFLSVKTVQYHLTRVYAKLGIRSRSELAARFREEE